MKTGHARHCEDSSVLPRERGKGLGKGQVGSVADTAEIQIGP